MTPHFLTSPHGERYLHEANRDAFVRRPSAEVFERWFETDLGAEDTLHLIVGTDSGLLPRWLADRPPGAGSHRLFIELDEYRELLGEAPAGIDGEDASLCAASDWEVALGALNPTRWLFGGKVVVVESVGCGSGYASGYPTLSRAVRTRIGEIVHSATVNVNARPFIEAQLRNAADARWPAAEVERPGEGRTAIVLGGGPSLDEHLDWTIAHRDRLFVIAVSRITDRLLDAGLEPDAVMAIDPYHLLFDISKRGLELEGVPLVHAYHACPELVQQWRGPTLYTGRCLPWRNDAFDDADNLPPVGPTVSHAALWTAFRWGFEQILLTGFDLCYAPGGTTHAKGSVEALCAQLPSHYDARVETYSGRRAGTAVMFKIGRDELERMGERIAEAGVRVYNLAAEAARVESIPHRSVDEVTLGEPGPPSRIGDGPSSAGKHLATMRRELEAARKGLREIRRGCRDARRCLDGLHGKRGRAPDYRHKRKLDAVDRAMERGQARWMEIVKRYGALDLARCVAPRGFEAMDDDEFERWGRNYYRVVDASAKRLGELVVGAIERVEHRRLELDPDVPVERLVDYWLGDDTPARALAFADDAAGGRASRTEAEREAIDRALAEHVSQLRTTDTGQRRRHLARQADAANALRAIALLHDEGGVEDLASIAEALDAMSGEWAPLARWAEGQRAELVGDVPGALERYRLAIEHQADMNERGDAPPAGAERLLEDVLIRIANLQLSGGDGESALEALTVLSGISPAYVPRRATLLGLLGRLDEAATSLQDLIVAGQGDWRTAMQLADLYERAGAGEAAAMAAELSRQLRAEADGGAVGGSSAAREGERQTRRAA